MKAILLLLITSLSFNVTAHEADTPPELWSWFKDLNKSKEACDIQSSFTLSELKLKNQTETEYGIYGHIKSNKIVVKCISTGPNQSKLMVAVAGHNKDSVKLIRDKIIKSIQ